MHKYCVSHSRCFKSKSPRSRHKSESLFESIFDLFHLQHAISDLILEYNAYGFLDQLQRKWYGRVPCLEDSLNNLNQPNPLTIRSVAGVFIMLGCGFIVGILILLIEHVVFKYSLPDLRKKPKECFWKSPNLMFFSQVL